jgi:hypothetical protein
MLLGEEADMLENRWQKSDSGMMRLDSLWVPLLMTSSMRGRIIPAELVADKTLGTRDAEGGSCQIREAETEREMFCQMPENATKGGKSMLLGEYVLLRDDFTLENNTQKKVNQAFYSVSCVLGTPIVLRSN